MCVVKQKTAYEMRMSDWRSDVCSSKLRDVEDVESPPAPHREADARVAHVGIERHVEVVTEPHDEPHPAGDHEPLLAPALHLQKGDAGRQARTEQAKDQRNLPALLAWRPCPASAPPVVVPEIAALETGAPPRRPTPVDQTT